MFYLTLYSRDLSLPLHIFTNKNNTYSIEIPRDYIQKTMKNIILVLCLTTISFPGIAQIEDFDLNNFEMPFFTLQRLNLTANTNGNHVKTTNTINDVTEQEQSFNLQFAPYYFLNSNKEFSQTTIEVSLRERGQFQKDDLRKTLTLNQNISVDLDHNYFYKNQQFIGASLYYNPILTNQKRTIDEEITTSKRRETPTRISLKWGIGRIHDITDTWRSINILQELQNSQRLSTDPSQDQIYALAKLSTRRNRISFFDSRLKMIEDLEAIDQFLKSEELITEDDITYYTTLQDNWIYGANTTRNKGHRFWLHFSPSITTSFYAQKESENEERTENWAFNGGATFQGFRPINQKWQWNYQAILLTGPSFSSTYERSDPRRMKFNQTTNLSSTIAYYPSTRSSFLSSISARYSNVRYQDVITPKSDFTVAWENQAYYYVSPQTRFSFNLDVSNQLETPSTFIITQTEINTNKEFRFNFSIGFTQYFF